MTRQRQLAGSARAVQDALHHAGIEARVVELPASTRTAREAAEAIGCRVAQIAKSIVFEAASEGTPVLVVASGTNRIDERLIANHLGDELRRATPAFVRLHTGFAIGGIPPCGHPQPIRTFIDEELLDFESVWAAAGTPHAVVELDPSRLRELTGGAIVRVC